MNRLLTNLFWFFALYAIFPAISLAATIEVPTSGSSVGGVGYVSGWKCPPNTSISISFDGEAPIPAAALQPRNDTASACRNDGRNGYILQWNWNILGDGDHVVSVRQAGIEFARATVHVTTFGTNFMRGASGACEVPSFPNPGQSVVLEWNEGSQNFEITGRTGPIGPLPTPRPTPNPSRVALRTVIGIWKEGDGFSEWRLQDTRRRPDGIWLLHGFDETGNEVEVYAASDFESDPPFKFSFVEKVGPSSCNEGYFDKRGTQLRGVRFYWTNATCQGPPSAGSNTFIMTFEGALQGSASEAFLDVPRGLVE